MDAYSGADSYSEEGLHYCYDACLNYRGDATVYGCRASNGSCYAETQPISGTDGDTSEFFGGYCAFFPQKVMEHVDWNQGHCITNKGDRNTKQNKMVKVSDTTDEDQCHADCHLEVSAKGCEIIFEEEKSDERDNGRLESGCYALKYKVLPYGSD